jgi:hypothetical protein
MVLESRLVRITAIEDKFQGPSSTHFRLSLCFHCGETMEPAHMMWLQKWFHISRYR